eukprot:scaffold36132_cov39-Attheya_sp.AAC.2
MSRTPTRRLLPGTRSSASISSADSQSGSDHSLSVFRTPSQNDPPLHQPVTSPPAAADGRLLTRLRGMALNNPTPTPAATTRAATMTTPTTSRVYLTSPGARPSFASGPNSLVYHITPPANQSKAKEPRMTHTSFIWISNTWSAMVALKLRLQQK